MMFRRFSIFTWKQKLFATWREAVCPSYMRVFLTVWASKIKAHAFRVLSESAKEAIRYERSLDRLIYVHNLLRMMNPRFQKWTSYVRARNANLRKFTIKRLREVIDNWRSTTLPEADNYRWQHWAYRLRKSREPPNLSAKEIFRRSPRYERLHRRLRKWLCFLRKARLPGAKPDFFDWDEELLIDPDEESTQSEPHTNTTRAPNILSAGTDCSGTSWIVPLFNTLVLLIFLQSIMYAGTRLVTTLSYGLQMIPLGHWQEFNIYLSLSFIFGSRLYCG